MVKKLEYWRAAVMLLVFSMTTSLLTGCGSSANETSSSTVSSSASAESSSDVSASASAEDNSVTVSSGSTSSVSLTDEEESSLLREIKERGYIQIVSGNDIPFAYQDTENDTISGIDVDILRAICEKLGIPDIQLKVVDYSNCIMELTGGNVDMVVAGMYVTEERKQTVAFSNIWYQESEGVVIRNDSDIQSKDDLKDKKVGAQPGTAFWDLAQEWYDNGEIGELVQFDTASNLMTAVNMGKIDACVTDGIAAAYAISQDSTLDLKMLSPYEPEAVGQIASAVRFEDEDFLAEVNEALAELKDDGTVLEILENYGCDESYFVSNEDGVVENIK